MNRTSTVDSQRAGEAAEPRRGWQAAPFWCGLASSLLLAAAYPPLGWWPLALFAPTPLIWLVRQPRLGGPRPYLWIWLGAAVGWLALLQGVRLPHWILYFGWFALSFYTAAYTPAFVALARTITLPLRLSIILVAPIVWVALELARGYLFTGFSVGLASHPLIPWTEMLQLAELGGAYAVSAVVIVVAASLARMVPAGEQRWAAWPLIPLTIVLGGAWLYGQYRLRQLPALAAEDGVPICLLQSNQDVIFVADPQRNVAIYDQCLQEAIRVKQIRPETRMFVWPESTFSANKHEVLIDSPPQKPADLRIDDERFRLALNWAIDDFEQHKRRTAKRINDAGRPFGWDDQQDDPQVEPRSSPAADAFQPAFQLLGTQSERFGEHDPERLNTAVFVDPVGNTLARYHKAHRVMFGEYVPLGDQFPVIYDWTPFRRGLTPGVEPLAFEVDGVRFSPNICFEITVPHLIRRQFRELAAGDAAPDVLVNVSNDGWFWGSSILDLHFACNVFRAVELRRDVVSSANTGVTAWVDDAGRVRARAPRREVASVLASVRPARIARSFYAQWGDSAAAVCLLMTLLGALFGWRKARRG